MAKSKRPVSKARQTPAKDRQTPKRKNRSIALTIVLILIMVHSILTAFVYLNMRNNSTTFIAPWVETAIPWFVTALFIAAVAKFVAAAAIWMWERWGIYLFLGASLVDVAIGIMLTGTTLIAINEILPVAILAWVVRDRMQDFK
jgi:uncharacterized membrane protein